jgi:hypothetical protein
MSNELQLLLLYCSFLYTKSKIREEHRYLTWMKLIPGYFNWKLGISVRKSRYKFFFVFFNFLWDFSEIYLDFLKEIPCFQLKYPGRVKIQVAVPPKKFSIQKQTAKLIELIKWNISVLLLFKPIHIFGLQRSKSA